MKLQSVSQLNDLNIEDVFKLSHPSKIFVEVSYPTNSIETTFGSFKMNLNELIYKINQIIMDNRDYEHDLLKTQISNLQRQIDTLQTQLNTRNEMFVTVDTDQTITGAKVFASDISCSQTISADFIYANNGRIEGELQASVVDV